MKDNHGNDFHALIFKPGKNPFRFFSNALVNQGYAETSEIDSEISDSTLTKSITAIKNSNEYWLIYIDQFEQLFTITESDEKRVSFIKNLVHLYKYLERQSQEKLQVKPIKIVLTMRADFIEKFELFPELGRITQSNIRLITRMHKDELYHAIEQPAAKNGVIFEEGLVEIIQKDVRGEAAYLPLLQYTLDLLWRSDNIDSKNTDRTLHIQTYLDLGGVRGALQKRVDYLFDSFTPDEQLAVKTIFINLVNVVETREGDNLEKVVSERTERSRFTDPLIITILDKLIDENLLVSDIISNEPTVEIAHESLLTSWDKLGEWVNAKRRVIATKKQIEQGARQWKKLKEEKTELESNDEYCLRGSQLEFVLEQIDQKTFDILGGLGSNEIIFVEASVKWRDRKLREKQKQVRQLLTAFIFAVLAAGFAVFTAGIAVWQWRESVDREATSKSLQLAAVATNSLHTDTTRSLLIAIQANVIRETPQSRTALWNAFKANHERYYLQYTDPLVYGEFDPHNSKRILTGSDQGEAVLWDLDQLDKPKIFKAHTGSIKRASFDPYNANRFLTVSSNDK
jgi:WD40 repeat protein